LTTDTSHLHADPRRWPDVARRILGGLSISLISTTLFFTILETVLRVANLAPTSSLGYPDAETWDRVPGPYEPVQELTDSVRPKLAYQVRINDLGFRGRDFPRAKEPGVLRVLCVGDSYTFGEYVNDDETFPAALERKLREAGHSRVEVINAGVNGYTITDEAAFLREKGFDLQPDAVVLGFVLNDLTDLTRKVSSRENQRNAAREMSSSALSPLKALLRRTATYNLLFLMKARAVARMKMSPTQQELPIDHLLHPPFDEVTEALFRNYGAELTSLSQDCQARNIDLTLVLFPFFEQVVRDASAEAQVRLAGIGADAGVNVVDLLPPFHGIGPTAASLFLMPLDHHPSAAGYEVAAREVSQALMTKRGTSAAALP
jgi:lysophospholipase L1-like esterase